MICTFFGHRDASDSIKEKVRDAVIWLIDNSDVKTFYVGNNGNFDYIVASVLSELAKEREELEYYVVTSFIGERVEGVEWWRTIFPKELERALPRFAIPKRNIWLICNSDAVIAYAKNGYSNADKWVEKARRRGLRVINLADEKSWRSQFMMR